MGLHDDLWDFLSDSSWDLNLQTWYFIVIEWDFSWFSTQKPPCRKTHGLVLGST